MLDNISNNQIEESVDSKIVVSKSNILSYILTVVDMVESISKDFSFKLVYFIIVHEFTYQRELAKILSNDSSPENIRPYIHQCISELRRLNIIKQTPYTDVRDEKIKNMIQKLKDINKKLPPNKIEIIELSDYVKNNYWLIDSLKEISKKRAGLVFSGFVDSYQRIPEDSVSTEVLPTENSLFSKFDVIRDILMQYRKEEIESFMSAGSYDSRGFIELRKLRDIVGEVFKWADVLEWRRERKLSN